MSYSASVPADDSSYFLDNYSCTLHAISYLLKNYILHAITIHTERPPPVDLYLCAYIM